MKIMMMTVEKVGEEIIQGMSLVTSRLRHPNLMANYRDWTQSLKVSLKSRNIMIKKAFKLANIKMKGYVFLWRERLKRIKQEKISPI